MLATSLQRTLLDRARSAAVGGDLALAANLYRSVLDEDSGQTEALNGLALVAVAERNLDRAVELLERARALVPDDALTLSNLARLHQTAGNTHEAIRTYAAVLTLSPELYTARIALASLLEQAGDMERALPRYFRSIVDAQKDGRWMSDQSTPPSLRPLIRHAIQTVDQGRRTLYAQALQPMVDRYGRGELIRVEAALRVYLGELVAQYADERQRPNFLYLPGLPATPYLEKALVPQLAALEVGTHLIRAELDALLLSEAGVEAVFPSKDLEEANLSASHGVPAWNGYYFHRYGEKRPGNHLRCPETSKLLESLPLCRVRQHGPETLFSVLAPGTHLLPHRGVTNTRIVGHLALIVPEQCRLRVGGEEYSWVEGEAVLFDDTYLHEAWNRSHAPRVVLIFDLWNPYLTQPEREALAELVSAIGDFRLAAELPLDGQP